MIRSASPTSALDQSEAHIFEVCDLHVEFRLGGRRVRAVNGVSFHVDPGETLAILGESGSGKSVTFDAVLGTLELPPGFVTGGGAFFRGRDLLRLPLKTRRSLCGSKIGMIFQDPLSALNPVFTVGWQIAEMFRIHQGLSNKEAMRKTVGLLERVGIPEASRRVNDHPHQFSGGMRQRVIIAMALAVDPEVVIADEPTTALDVTVEAQILDLLKSLQRDRGIGLILITHSMGVVAEIADRLAVMYCGRIVETGPVRDIFRRAAHPYTRGLINSIPRPGGHPGRLVPIGGQPPDLARIPAGCAFHPRCPVMRDVCLGEVPMLRWFGEANDRANACFLHDELMPTS